MKTVDEYIRAAKTLPTAPRIVSELLELLGHSDAPADRVVEL